MLGLKYRQYLHKRSQHFIRIQLNEQYSQHQLKLLKLMGKLLVHKLLLSTIHILILQYPKLMSMLLMKVLGLLLLGL